MNALKGLAIAAVFAWAAPAAAADAPQHHQQASGSEIIFKATHQQSHHADAPDLFYYKVVSGSEISYQVHVTTLGVLHETITGRDTQVRGAIFTEPNGSPSGWFESPVTGFDSGIHGRDRDVAQLLGVRQFPTVRFAVDHVEGFDRRVPSGRAVVVGTLMANGHSQAIHIPVHYVSAPPYLRVDGEVPMRFTDFGIAPPVLGLVIKRAPDQLMLRAHLVAKELL